MDDDRDLVRQAGQGQQSAWDALVARYGSRVWAVARAFRLSQADAEDVFQTTWLHLVTHLDGIRDPERIGAWLATTARNECLGALRRAGRQAPTDGDALDVPDMTGPAVDAGVLASERDAQLWEAVGALSGPCQRLLRALLADPAPSYVEVSAALGMPVGSIGPTRARCLRYLRTSLLSITGAPDASQ